MRITSLLVLLALVGCVGQGYDGPKDKIGKDESTGPGVVRSIDWYNRNFLFESQNGYSKLFKPICDGDILVWQGEQVKDIIFYVKHPWGESGFRCYAIKDVIR